MDFLIANLPLLWIVLLVAALALHLVRLAAPSRWLHSAYAASAIGLILVLGARTYGWSVVSPAVLMWVFLLLFLAVAAVAARRRIERGRVGLPWLSALIQLGAVTYMFAPAQFWKPPLAFLLLLYFAAELVTWLRGQEEEIDVVEDDGHRPPLFQPMRRRGLTEAALAAAAATMIYLLAVGPRAPMAAPEEPQQAASETETPSASAAESAAPASESASAESGSSASEAPAPDAASTAEPKIASAEPGAPPEAPPPASAYTVVKGDTFKTIAKRLFGDRKKWTAIAAANPGVDGNKLRAGQSLKLPDPPQP